MRLHPRRVLKKVLQTILFLFLLILLLVDVPAPPKDDRHKALREEMRKLQVALAPTAIQMDQSFTNETNAQRIDRMRRVCESSATHREKKGPINQNLMVDIMYHTVNCVPAKVDSTNWKFLMVKLHKFKFVRPAKMLKLHKAATLNEANITYLYEHTPKERDKYLRDYYKYIVVRHPWIRLIAGYKEQFEELEKDSVATNPLVKQIKEKFDPLGESGSPNVVFSEYVQYVLSNVKKPEELDRKWMPVRYACEPCSVNYDYIVKLENIDLDLLPLFYKINVTGHKTPYFGTIIKHDPPVSQMMYYYENVSESDYIQLSQVYKADFDLFGYTIPKRPQKLFLLNNNTST